jgi:hypothetical protein
VSLLLILLVPRIAILAEATEVGQSNSCYEQVAALTLFKVSYDKESCIAISLQSLLYYLALKFACLVVCPRPQSSHICIEIGLEKGPIRLKLLLLMMSVGEFSQPSLYDMLV